MTDENATPRSFFVLLLGLSIPLWWLGAVIDEPLLPGLPASALMVICPAIAGAVSAFRSGGRPAVATLLARAVDGRRMHVWAWPVALCTMPLVMLVSGVVLVGTGIPLPAPEIEIGQTLALFALFLAAATAEEIGWTGHAADALLGSRGFVATVLIIGAASVIWHVIPLLQVDRGWSWIGWWACGTMARRALILWLYVRGGRSVFGASLFHAMSNVSWMLFPVLGSHYDPKVTALVLLLPSLAALSFGAASHEGRGSASTHRTAPRA